MVDLLDPLAVDEQHPVGAVDDPVEVGDLADRGARVVAGEEAQLVLVQVADAGQVALVEQRLGDARGPGRAASRRTASAGSQSSPSRSGPRWPTTVSSSVGAAPARRRRARTRPPATPRPVEDHAGLVRRPPPALARPVEVPGALHLEVGVQGAPSSNRVSRCLPRDALAVDRAPARSAVGELRHPEVAPVTCAPLERLVEPCAPSARRCRPQASASRSPRGVAYEARAAASARRRAVLRSPLPSSVSPSARLDRQPAERARRGTARRERVGGAAGCAVGVVGERQQRAAAALDVDDQLAVDQHHEGAGLAARPVADAVAARRATAARRRRGWRGRSRPAPRTASRRAGRRPRSSGAQPVDGARPANCAAPSPATK